MKWGDHWGELRKRTKTNQKITDIVSLVDFHQSDKIKNNFILSATLNTSS